MADPRETQCASFCSPDLPGDPEIFPQVLPPTVLGPEIRHPVTPHHYASVFTESKIVIYKNRNTELIHF